MSELIVSNWPAFLVVVVVALLVALWLLRRPKPPADRSYRPDVLDEGVERAQRNQALIDAPRAGDTDEEPGPPATPEGLAGVGTAVGAAALVSEHEHDRQPEPAPSTAAGDVAGQETREEPTFAPNDPSTTPASAVAAAVKIDNADAADDLLRIKGLGPKLMAMLGSMGISRYDQIAAWSDEDVQRIDAQLGRFKGRIDRDDWRGQARYLAAGDTEGYESRFGKL